MPGPTGISQDQWDALVKRHGGIAGVTIGDQYRDIVPGVSGVKQLNPDPSYKYVFNDGTEITMRRQRDATNVQPDGYGAPVNVFEVVDPGSALKTPSDEGKPPDIHTNPDGSQSIWDRAKGAYVPYANAKAPAPFLPGKPTIVGKAPTSIDPSYLQEYQTPQGQWVTDSVSNLGFDPEAAQQAKDDRQRALNAQARSQQLAEQSAALAQQKFVYDQQQDAIRNELAKGQLSLNQAIAAATEAHNRYTAQVQKTQNDLTQRGQDAQMRNTEISTAGQIGSEASRAATASLSYLAPKGSTENISKAISSIGSGGYAPVQYGAIPTSAFPFDPTQVGLNVTKQVLVGFMGNDTGFQAPPRPAAVDTNVQMPQPVFTAPA